MIVGLLVHVSPPSLELSTDTLAHLPPFQSALPYVSSPSTSVPSDNTRIMPPIEPENVESVKICRGADHVAPALVDLLKNVCDLNDREWKMPWSDACLLPPGVTRRSQVA